MKPIFYAATTDIVTKREHDHAALARRICAEGIVLLENDGVLPLKTKCIALYGTGARHTAFGGTGSGENNPRYTINVEQGLENGGFTVTSKAWLDAYDALYAERYAAYRTELAAGLKTVSRMEQMDYATDYSRQACAEPITIAPDGTIQQVEITSCGLNGAPLQAVGSYPAVICCNLTNGKMPHGSNKKIKKPIPCVFSDEKDRFVHRIGNGTWIGYKYFDFNGTARLKLTVRGEAEGKLIVANRLNRAALAELPVSTGVEWHEISASVPFGWGKNALFLCYQGKGTLDLRDFTFEEL